MRAPGQAPPNSPALKGRNPDAGARQSHRYCSSYSIPCFFNKLRDSILNDLFRWCSPGSPGLILSCRSRAIPIPPFQGGGFGGLPPGARTASLRLRVASPGLYSQAPPGPRNRTPRNRIRHRSCHCDSPIFAPQNGFKLSGGLPSARVNGSAASCMSAMAHR